MILVLLAANSCWSVCTSSSKACVCRSVSSKASLRDWALPLLPPLLWWTLVGFLALVDSPLYTNFVSTSDSTITNIHVSQWNLNPPIVELPSRMTCTFYDWQPISASLPSIISLVSVDPLDNSTSRAIAKWSSWSAVSHSFEFNLIITIIACHIVT